jgi:hypothetical protein
MHSKIWRVQGRYSKCKKRLFPFPALVQIGETNERNDFLRESFWLLKGIWIMTNVARMENKNSISDILEILKPLQKNQVIFLCWKNIANSVNFPCISHFTLLPLQFIYVLMQVFKLLRWLGGYLSTLI